jgi:DNA polymerase sigma
VFFGVYKRFLTVKNFAYVEKVVCQVPIIKLKDKTTGLTADITFNREDGYKGVICAV